MIRDHSDHDLSKHMVRTTSDKENSGLFKNCSRTNENHYVELTGVQWDTGLHRYS